MELKVWCDNIQRVVCGVSTQTTCQEVVFALAHATGQTGRFILIEKFRASERLLAPNEHPLQVLSKWGEYANDVTFVMKRSEQQNKTVYNLNNSINSSPSQSQSQSAPTTASPLLLTTASSGAPITANAGPVVANGSPNRKFVLFSNTNSFLNKKSAFGQQSSGSSLPMTAKTQTTDPNPNPSPQKSNSCLNSSHNNNSNTNTLNNSLNNKTFDSNTNCRQDLTPTKQLNQKNNNNSNELTTTTPTKQCSATSHRPRHPPPYSEAINKSALIGSTGSPDFTANNTSSSHLNQVVSSTADPITGQLTNKRRSVEPSPQHQKQRTKDLLLHRDAVRLVDMQKETMRTQEKEMSTLEQQITSIDSKLLENELLVKRYKEEMENCHQLWLDQEMVIDQLDQQLLAEELDELCAKAKCYDEEVANVKKKLSSCEADIGDCRQKITKLMDQLEDSDRAVKLSAQEKDESERLLSEQLRHAIRDKNLEIETQKSELQTLTNNIQQLDTVLSEKSTEMDRLLSELKEANIQGLALQTTGDESQRHCTNSRAQPFHQRSGSTRRIIGSPRQLENAVATNKNPHGVWV